MLPRELAMYLTRVKSSMHSVRMILAHESLYNSPLQSVRTTFLKIVEVDKITALWNTLESS
jgi:hypothetical protein